MKRAKRGVSISALGQVKDVSKITNNRNVGMTVPRKLRKLKKHGSPEQENSTSSKIVVRQDKKPYRKRKKKLDNGVRQIRKRKRSGRENSI